MNSSLKFQPRCISFMSKPSRHCSDGTTRPRRSLFGRLTRILHLTTLRRFFATFCAFTYLEQKFSFLDKELDRYVADGLSFNRMSPKTAANVIRDLHECICMLQKDGLHTTFVH